MNSNQMRTVVLAILLLATLASVAGTPAARHPAAPAAATQDAAGGLR